MIEVEHLSKTYGSTAAIADVSFSVETGEIMGFLGPNGAGKTTTMRILSGYLPASSGTARIAGLDIHQNSMAVRQRIGYLPENPPLYPEMTVEGFLFFVARIKQVSPGDRARRVTSAIDRCGLVEKRKVLIRKLSKGFKQRVGIAQAIVHDPPVIILDEPTVGLDPRQIIEVRNLIKSLGGQHTIILSTHILPEVSMTCNRVTIINRGQIVAAGSPQNLTGELAASSGYELEVEGEEELVNSLLLPAVENLPGVRSIELIANPDSLADRYRLRALCEPDLESGREIAAAIIASGFGLCEMRRNRATLEDVFLKLTTAEKKQGDVLIETEPEVGENLEVAETTEVINDSEPQSEPIVAVEESIVPHSEPESEPIVERLESIGDVEPELQSVADFLEIVEKQESIDYSQTETIVETQQSLADSEPETIVETQQSLADSEPETIVETQQSLADSEPETVVETQQSLADSEPETIVETQQSLADSPPETVVETQQSLADSPPEPEPEPEPVVRNMQIEKKQQPSSDTSPEQPPVTKKRRQIETNPHPSDNSETPPAGDPE